MRMPQPHRMTAIGFDGGSGCCYECAEIVCDDDCAYAYARLLGGRFIPDYMLEELSRDGER